VTADGKERVSVRAEKLADFEALGRVDGGTPGYKIAAQELCNQLSAENLSDEEGIMSVVGCCWLRTAEKFGPAKLRRIGVNV
jgi:hypothetical protein